MLHTLNPITTGSSVLGVKYSDGVMLVTDTLISYGNLKKFTRIERFYEVNDFTVIAASGEFSDFQYISDELSKLNQQDSLADDEDVRSPKEITNYLASKMLQRRNKMNPLFNSVIVGGYDLNRGSFLGLVDLFGTFYEDKYVATGYGAHLAMPLLRERQRDDMSEDEVRELLTNCMRVLYTRDCKATDQLQFAKVTPTGVEISAMVHIEAKWDYDLALTATTVLGDKLGASW
jgi:20S proteasome subunit beta 7